jgi:hypothetical protein
MLKKLAASEKYWKRLIMDSPEEGARESVKIPVFGPLEHAPA